MGEVEEEYNLKKSLTLAGPLYPVLMDAHGNIIDGYHRKEEDPNWPEQKLDHIQNPVQLAIARLIANVCRRDVPAQEKTQWLKEIAELTGWTPKQISENLPVSYTWVMKYIPNEFKDKEMQELATRRVAREEKPKEIATKEPSPLTSYEKQLLSSWVKCDKCGVLTKGQPDEEGKIYCSLCQTEKPEPQKDVTENVTPSVQKRISCARCGNPTLKPKEVDGQQYCQVCSAIVKAAPKKRQEEVETESDLEQTQEEPGEEEEPIDTGIVFECPTCYETYNIIHVAPGKHELRPIREA